MSSTRSIDDKSGATRVFPEALNPFVITTLLLKQEAFFIVLFFFSNCSEELEVNFNKLIKVLNLYFYGNFNER